MSDTLKPCPFCGCEAERPRPNDPHGGMVQCVSCGASAFGPKWNRRSAAPTANCCKCGRIVDTREIAEGGDTFGEALEDGRWTCSIECWETIVARALGMSADAASEGPDNG